MIKPAPKAPGIDALLTAVTGKSRTECIENGLCTLYDAQGIDEHSFTDALSLTEYTISGMCQKWQDALFSEDPFDISRDCQ